MLNGIDPTWLLVPITMAVIALAGFFLKVSGDADRKSIEDLEREVEDTATDLGPLG